MGTIIERKRSDGSVAYLAQVSIMRNGRFVHRESRTFDRRVAAERWIRNREYELAKGLHGQTLADAIDTYIADNQQRMGRTKLQVLQAIKTYPIAAKPCALIESKDIVEFAKELSEGRKPQTVQNYMSHLSAVFAIAHPAWGYGLDYAYMIDASKVAKRLGLTAKARRRDRRPSIDELNRLMGHFDTIKKRRPSSIPMCKIVAFALFSTRRLDEITRITWDDLDVDGKRVLVRDMKHPGDKMGNDAWCDLPDPSLQIIQSMPVRVARIFPYNNDAISAAFTRACKALGIEDLHLHDMRHEGVSRLFEMGLNIPHVAAVSGHRSWQSLQRYTHLRQTGDKYAGWEWIKVVTS